MKWITREYPKIDCIACPWLIAKFVDMENPQDYFSAFLGHWPNRQTG